MIDEIFCCVKESKRGTNLWCRHNYPLFFFFHVLPSMAKGCYLRKDAVIWLPFVPWCLKAVYQSMVKYVDVFKINFVTGSDEDETSKLKLKVMKASITHTKEKFGKEFRDSRDEKGEKNDDEEMFFDKLWNRFWEPFEKSEFEKYQWMRIKNVWKPDTQKTAENELCKALEKIITHKVTGEIADIICRSDEENDSDDEQSNEATIDNVSNGNVPDKSAVLERKERRAEKRKARNDKIAENTLSQKLNSSKKPRGKITSSPKKNGNLDNRIIMTQIIENEEIIENEQQSNHFGACFGFRVKEKSHMKWLKSRVANWMNQHGNVVIDANGKDKTGYFLHLTEFQKCGSSKIVRHNSEKVKKLMSHGKNNAKGKKAATMAPPRPQCVFLFWTPPEKDSHCVKNLDVLEMPSGEHNGETIAQLLETVLRYHGFVIELPVKLMDSSDHKKLTEQNESTERNDSTELDEWTGTECPNWKLIIALDENGVDKEFNVVMQGQDITQKHVECFLLPRELSWALKSDKIVEVEEKIEIGKLFGTTVVGAKFESDEMNDLLKSMAMKGEFKFAMEMVLDDVNVNGTREVVWFSALVKKLNAKRMTLADREEQNKQS